MERDRIVFSEVSHPDGSRHRRARGNGALWFGVFGAPAAWSVDLLAALAVQQSWCSARTSDTLVPFRGVGVWLVVLGILTGGIAVAAGLSAWRALAALGRDSGYGETDLDRRRFMARAGVVISLLFLFGIVLRWAATFIVDPTLCQTLV